MEPAGSGVTDLRAYRLFAFTAFPAYLLWTHFTIGLRAEHAVITGAFMFMFGFNRKTVKFAVLVVPFLLVGVLYDNLRLVIDYRADIHVADLFNAELALFGINTEAGRIILPDFFMKHTHWFLDFICGAAYLLYLVEVVAFGLFFFWRDQFTLSRFAWAFLLINVMGMITWLAYPAAPPWYVQDYGLGPAVLDALPSPAGALRFDELLGITVFQGFYSRSANVFGAMPSLHCGYPTVVLLCCLSLNRRYQIGAAAFLALVAFSAVYLSHHYVLDVIAGIAYGIAAYLVVAAVQNKVSKRAEQVG